MADYSTEQDSKDRISDDYKTLMEDDDQDGAADGTTETTALSRCITDASAWLEAEVSSAIDITAETATTIPRVLRMACADVANYFFCTRRNQHLGPEHPVSLAFDRAHETAEKVRKGVYKFTDVVQAGRSALQVTTLHVDRRCSPFPIRVVRTADQDRNRVQHSQRQSPLSDKAKDH